MLMHAYGKRHQGILGVAVACCWQALMHAKVRTSELARVRSSAGTQVSPSALHRRFCLLNSLEPHADSLMTGPLHCIK